MTNTRHISRVVHSSIGELCARASSKAQIFFLRLQRANAIYKIFSLTEAKNISEMNIGSTGVEPLLLFAKDTKSVLEGENS